jgi:hypothetical protein
VVERWVKMFSNDESKQLIEYTTEPKLMEKGFLDDHISRRVAVPFD